MRTILITFITLIAFAMQGQSNRLDYYQHTKTVYANGNVINQDGQKGQFIRRINANGNKMCYDATSSGLDHLNGALFFAGKNNNREVYKGNCFWGNNCTYQFDDVNGYLNIKDSSGNVYVFRRAQAPSGRKHSSYLKSNASVDGYDAAAEWNRIHYGEGGTGNQTEINRSNNNQKHKQASSSHSSRECGYCHGSKRVLAHKGTGSYGVSVKKKKCPTCNEWYDPANDHWHACPYCK